MAEVISTHILVDRTEVFNEEGLVKTEVLPANMTGASIAVGPTPPSNPTIGQLWIDTSE